MKSGDTSRQHTIFMPFWINNIYRSSGRKKLNEKFTRANIFKTGLVSTHQLNTLIENWFDEFCCCCCCFNTYFYSCISIAKLHSITTFSTSLSLFASLCRQMQFLRRAIYVFIQKTFFILNSTIADISTFLWRRETLQFCMEFKMSSIGRDKLYFSPFE